MFLEIERIIDKDILEYKTRIFDAKEVIIKKRELEKIIKKFERKEVYIDDVRSVQDIFPSLSSYFKLLDDINNMMNLLNNKDFKNIDIIKYKNVLEKGEYTDNEVVSLTNYMDILKRSYHHVHKDNYKDDAIRKKIDRMYENVFYMLDETFQIVFSKLIIEIKNRYNRIGSTILLENEIKESNKQIKKLEEIKELVDSGLKKGFKSKAQFDAFKKYFIEKVPIDLQKKYIDEAGNRILDEKIIIKSFEDLDLRKFNKEERKIINRIKEIYNEKKILITDRLPVSDIESSKGSYVSNYQVNWKLILSDVENYLLPNIYRNKKSVISHFALIIEHYENEIKAKEEYKDKIKTINETIDIVKKFMSLNNINDTRYDGDFIIGTAEDNPKFNGKYYRYYLGYFIRTRVKDFLDKLEFEKELLEERLENNEISFQPEEIISLNDIIVELEYIKNEIKRILNECSKIGKDKEDQRDISLEKGNKNIIFCLDDVVLNGAEGKNDDSIRKELEESVKMMSHYTFRGANFSGLTENNGTIGQKEFKIEGKYFEAFRARGTKGYRTGMIHFKRVHPIIKQNIKDRYNLDSDCAILAVFSVSIIDAGHSQYQKVFAKYINEHWNELEKLGEMFSNPNTDMNKLYEIIDRGIGYRNDLIEDKSDNKKIGF